MATPSGITLNSRLEPVTYLFVPALTIERVEKAFARGADAVIVDLEDAVSEDVKYQCQQKLIHYTQLANSQAVWVRVNSVSSDWFTKDLEVCKDLPNIAGIVLPKVESSRDIAKVTEHIKKPVIALIETPQGMQNIAEIATAIGLKSLSFGFLDICEKLNVRADSEAGQMIANQIRYQLLLHSAINQLTPPIECVYPPFNDNEGLAKRVTWWADLGFSGMLCIHPNQIKLVQELIKPSQEQLDFAKKVTDYYQKTGLAAFVIDGQMIDTPVIKQAQNLLNNNQ